MDATLRMKECDTMRILVVEDDRLLNNTLCYNLDAAGYVVDSALTKSAASNFLTKQDYDLIVLDVNLPDGNDCHRGTMLFSVSHSNFSSYSGFSWVLPSFSSGWGMSIRMGKRI